MEYKAVSDFQWVSALINSMHLASYIICIKRQFRLESRKAGDLIWYRYIAKNLKGLLSCFKNINSFVGAAAAGHAWGCSRQEEPFLEKGQAASSHQINLCSRLGLLSVPTRKKNYPRLP